MTQVFVLNDREPNSDLLIISKLRLKVESIPILRVVPVSRIRRRSELTFKQLSILIYYDN